MTIQEPLDPRSLLHRMTLFSQQIRARSGDSLALDPLYIPALITPVQTPGADGGLNYNALHQHADGLLVLVQSYSNMRVGDWIDVYFGDDTVPVASDQVLEEHIDDNFALFIAASKVPEGVHKAHYSVTRAGSGNKELSLVVNVLVRLAQPGGTDPEPDRPGHQNLAPPVPDLPPGGIIDEEAARNGVKVSIAPYPNMREYDRITLSWGGEFVTYQVKADEVGQAVEITVPEAIILKAGDSDELVLVYRVMDEVHNQSSDWSLRSHVIVEVEGNRPDAPLIVNPDDAADPYDVIDLDKLGDDDLFVDVMVIRNGGIAVGDSVTLTWVGTTAQGEAISFTSEAQNVPRVPTVLSFEVPNADVRGLGHGRGVASYKLERSDGSDVTSKRAFVTFIGVEQKLPKPTVSEAVGGSLDPELPLATVVVPGAALQSGDWVTMTWLGTQASGSPLLHTAERQVSANGGGSPMRFSVPGSYIKPLDGGRLEVSYEILRTGLEAPLKSEREHLQVGEAQNALPAPTVNPAAVDGWLDPDLLPNGVNVVIAPYPNMRAGQDVHFEWRATLGGSVTDYMSINEFSAGRPVLFPIDQDQLRENAEGEVEVWYRVEEPGQPTRHSRSLHLKIGKEQEEEAPLIAPVVPDAVDGILDPAQVPNGAKVWVSYTDMALGDVLTLFWQGTTDEARYESPPQAGSQDGFVEFIVPPAVVEASAGEGDAGAVTVFYRLARPGRPVRTSPETLLNVTLVEEAPLIAPTVLEATGGSLDPLDTSDGATVRVSYADMTAADVVVVHWVGADQEGSHESEPHAGSTLGYIDVVVPSSVVWANEGQQVRVHYTRSRNGVPKASPELTLSVLEVPVKDLPTPVIPQASSGQLDVLGLSGNARVTVQAWPLIASGQHYWLRAYGKLKNGSAYTIDLALGETVTEAEVGTGLNVVLLRSELMKLLNRSELQVELKVALKGDQSEAGATPFPRRKVTVRTETQLLVENFLSVPLGSYGPGGTFPSGFETAVMKVDVLTGRYVLTTRQNFPNGRGFALWHGATQQHFSVRFTPKQQASKVNIQIMWDHSLGGAANFYDDKGALIGTIDMSAPVNSLVTKTFPAPAGKQVAKIEVRSGDFMHYTRFEFEV